MALFFGITMVGNGVLSVSDSATFVCVLGNIVGPIDRHALTLAERVQSPGDLVALAQRVNDMTDTHTAVRAVERAVERLPQGLTQSEWQRVFNAFTSGSHVRALLIIRRKAMVRSG